MNLSHRLLPLLLLACGATPLPPYDLGMSVSDLPGSPSDASVAAPDLSSPPMDLATKPDLVGLKSVGQPCTNDNQCLPDLSCITRNNFVNGVCDKSRTCTILCMKSQECTSKFGPNFHCNQGCAFNNCQPN